MHSLLGAKDGIHAISGVKNSPEIYISKSIVTDGGNYLK